MLATRATALEIVEEEDDGGANEVSIEAGIVISRNGCAPKFAEYGDGIAAIA